MEQRWRLRQTAPMEMRWYECNNYVYNPDSDAAVRVGLILIRFVSIDVLERAGGNGENQKVSPKSYFDGDKYLHTVSLKNNDSTHKLVLADVWRGFGSYVFCWRHVMLPRCSHQWCAHPPPSVLDHDDMPSTSCWWYKAHGKMCSEADISNGWCIELACMYRSR